MPDTWQPLPLDKALFQNLDEDAVVGFQTAIENGFINELGGHTRFPGLTTFAELGGRGRVYLHDINGDLIAATNQGQIFRIDRNANVTNVTGLPVAGGRRVVFAKTDKELLMAAGGPIVRLRTDMSELLSPAAPLAAFVGWVDNFTIAVEINSGRFFHSNAGEPDKWDPLDVFAADGNPDNINSLLITPFREVLLGGDRSVEQFERLPTGDVPFFRRWAIGDGIKQPYAIISADNAVFTVNGLSEFVRYSGQSPQLISDPIGRVLEKVDNWQDAWIGGYPDLPCNILGQKFLILQMPNATNSYGTKGITFLYDYRAKKFSELYGWDSANGAPTRWPGWSHWRLWDRMFVGGEGVIYELTDSTYYNAGAIQRWLVRTSHMAKVSMERINNFRLQVVRGKGTPTSAAKIMVRCSRDGKPFSNWIIRTLGLAGQRQQMLEFGSFGVAETFRFEIACTDDSPVDLIGAHVRTEPVGH